MKGFYFLANDSVIKETIAFLISFRLHNPLANLCLIPYDNNTSNIVKLSTQFDFIIFDVNNVLTQLDYLTTKLFGNTTNKCCRKLACYFGLYDTFAYIDSDIVVFEPLDWVFHYPKIDVLVGTSDIPNSIPDVWNIDTLDHLLSFYPQSKINFSANTGFFVSRKLWTWSFLIELIDSILYLIPYVNSEMTDQPLLNILWTESNLRKQSLSNMFYIEPNTPQIVWSGIDGGHVENGGITWSKGEYYNKRIAMIHWAGYGLERIQDWGINDGIQIEPPYLSLWLYYYRLYIT